MRNAFRFVVLLVCISGLVATAKAQCNTNCCNSGCPERRTIAASGTGVVTADADLAVVRFSAKIYGTDAITTSASAADTESAIDKALVALGVSKAAIEATSPVLARTQSFELQQGGMEAAVHRQFNLTQTWIVRVKPDQADAVLKAAVDAGAGESAWVQWIVQDPAGLQARAAALAYANARSTAEQIAQKSGVRLGDLIGVSDAQRQMNYGDGCCSGSVINGMGDTLITVTSMMGNSQPVTVNTARIEIRASVTATFDIAAEPAAAAK
jgi:uncharacterized protein YggE